MPMRRPRLFPTLAIGLLIALFTASSAYTQPGTVGEDEREIRDLIDRYAAAVETADPNDAAQVWETSEEVSFIQPRGHQKGWEEIKTGFYDKTMGENFSKRKLTVEEPTLAIRVYGDAAWAEFYWTFHATMRKDGSPITTKGRETQVLRKTPGGWRIVHVHYSGMPKTGERQGF